jgi:hypothetical protein
MSSRTDRFLDRRAKLTSVCLGSSSSSGFAGILETEIDKYTAIISRSAKSQASVSRTAIRRHICGALTAHDGSTRVVLVELETVTPRQLLNDDLDVQDNIGVLAGVERAYLGNAVATCHRFARGVRPDQQRSPLERHIDFPEIPPILQREVCEPHWASRRSGDTLSGIAVRDIGRSPEQSNSELAELRAGRRAPERRGRRRVNGAPS